MTFIEQILVEHGPMMSGQLSKLLSLKENSSENTASQKISRSKQVIKIKGFFSSQQSFCYLEEHKRSYNLYELLSSAMFEYGRKYWYCLNALKLNNGMILKEELECYTNYPIEKLKGHKPFSEIMSNFINAKIVSYENDCYYFTPGFSSNIMNIVKSKVISQIKRSVLNDFMNVIKNIGLVSYNTVELFAEYGKFRWGIKGVSYISGLKNGNSPGFLLGDIILGNSFYDIDIDFFIKKIEQILSFSKAPRLIPFLIVDNLHEKALNELKKKGIIVGFIGELFGEKYVDALRELVGMLNNIGASLQDSPEKFTKLISELEVYNKTLIYNIKGSLFEYFVANLIQRNYPNNIEIGRIIYGENKKHELDVFAYNTDNVIIIECKATQSAIDEDEIIKWQRSVIPLVREYIRTQQIISDKNIIFEYWSISGFSPKAKKRLEDFKRNTSAFEINYLDAFDIKAHIDKLKNKSLSNTFNNYFLKSNL